MAILYSNNAYATLAAGINSSATALTVASGLGARFPAISGSDFFYVTLVDSAGNLEIVKVTARATDAFTIVRAQDSTTAQAFSLGDGVQLRIIKALLDVFPQTGGPLGTPSSGTLTNATGLSISTGVSGLGTGIATALAVNVGTAGSPVVNGGALGSPSTAGTIPAFTLGGTVAGGGNQINNVVIGTTNPLAGAFTTVSASGLVKVKTATSRANITTDADLVTENGLGVLSTSTTYGQGYQYIRLMNSATTYAGSISQTAASAIGLFSASDLTLGANSAAIATVSSTGLAVTGTLSASSGNFTTTGGFLLGADIGATTVTNSTRKAGIIAVPHYTNSASKVAQSWVDSDSTANLIYYGGGLDGFNSATQHNFVVGATTTTAVGTVVATISSTGLAVTGTISATGTISNSTSTADGATAAGQFVQTGTARALYVVRSTASATRAMVDFSQNSATGGNENAVHIQQAVATAPALNIDTDGSTSTFKVLGNGATTIGGGLAVTGTLSATGTLSGGTSGTAYSFSGSAPATSLTLNSSGNLGVGTTSPTLKLSIGGSSTALLASQTTTYAPSANSAATSFNIFNDSATNNAYASLEFWVRNVSNNINIAYIASPSVSTNDVGTLTFGRRTGDATSAESMRIDSSGNLGIGSTAPVSRISATGSSATDFKALTLRNSSGTTNSAAVLNFEASSGTEGDAAATAAQIKGIREGAGTNGALAFWTSLAGTSTERARIDSSGNLGIGTASPTQKLEVSGSSQSGIIYSKITNTYNGSPGQGTALQFYGWDAGITANIKSIRTGQSYSPSALTFETYGGNGTTNPNTLAERGRFDDYGNFQLQKNLSVGAATPSTSGAGITFPATQSASTDANTLDDYEEGTWTPADASGAGLSLTINSSSYTKVGRLVTCTADITYPSTASTTNAELTVPFVMASGSNYSQMGPPIRNNASLSIQIFGLVNSTPSTFIMLIIGQFTTYATNVNLTGARLQFTYTYQSA